MGYFFLNARKCTHKLQGDPCTQPSWKTRDFQMLQTNSWRSEDISQKLHNIRFHASFLWLSRYCSKITIRKGKINLIRKFFFGLSKNVENTASHIRRKAMEIVPGRSPISVAAVAILMVSRSPASEKGTFMLEIGNMAGVAVRTIRKSYQLMCSRPTDLFPESFSIRVGFPRKLEKIFLS